MKHYSALAAAFLAGKIESDAQIVYKNLGDVELTTQVFTLDLNNDSIPDFEIRADYSVRSTYCSHDETTISHRVENFAYNQEIGMNTQLYKLQCGDMISAGKEWVSGDLITDFFWKGFEFYNGHCSYDYPASSSSGNWKENEQGYAGLKFRIGTQTHYAWVRFFINSYRHIVIEDCAYEATADQPIPAGKVECADQTPAIPFHVGGCIGSAAIIPVINYSNCLNYTWFEDGRIIATDSGSLKTDSSGNYWIVSNDRNGCVDTSNVSVVTIHSNPPVPKITELNDTLNSPLSAKYQWFEDADPILGATKQEYTPQYNSYYYQVKVTDSNGCFSYSSLDTFASCNIIHNLYQDILYEYETIPHDTMPMCIFSINYGAAWINAVYNGTYQYQWFKNGSVLTNDIAFDLHIMDTGQYYCKLTGYGITCNTDTLTVLNNYYPEPLTPTITRTGNTLESSDAFAYQWFNDIRIAGAIDQSFTPPANGVYTVEAIDSEGCGSLSNSYEFASCSLVDPMLNLSDTVTTCAGNLIKLKLHNLYSPGPYYYRYDWILNGDNIAYTYSNYYNATSSGLYYCNIEVPDTTYESTLCASSSVYLLFIDKPHVSLHDDTLVSSSSKFNQWVKDGEIIPGANGRFYAPASSGSYAVIVSPTDTCSMMSDYFSYSITSVQNNLNQKAPLISYINSKLLQVKFFNSDFLQGKIKIINALGQPLREIAIDKNVMQIPFTENETGWFVLDMEKDEHRFFSPVMIF